MQLKSLPSMSASLWWLLYLLDPRLSMWLTSPAPLHPFFFLFQVILLFKEVWIHQYITYKDILLNNRMRIFLLLPSVLKRRECPISQHFPHELYLYGISVFFHNLQGRHKNNSLIFWLLKSHERWICCNYVSLHKRNYSNILCVRVWNKSQ